MTVIRSTPKFGSAMRGRGVRASSRASLSSSTRSVVMTADAKVGDQGVAWFSKIAGCQNAGGVTALPVTFRGSHAA
jgi:hypothetical protein